MTMQFSVYMNWQCDLSTNAMNPLFVPLTINIQAVVDDQKTGVILFPPDTTRILFGGVSIASPLSSLVPMGHTPSPTDARYPSADVQDTFITPTNQGTWISLDEEFWGTNTSYGRNFQYTNLPRLTDPLNFDSDDFYSLLLSTVGQTWGYREDSGFPGGGFQTHGDATLLSVTGTQTSVPEPSTSVLFIAGTLLFRLLWQSRTR
jgi:hypothetical protein